WRRRCAPGEHHSRDREQRLQPAVPVRGSSGCPGPCRRDHAPAHQPDWPDLRRGQHVCLRGGGVLGAGGNDLHRPIRDGLGPPIGEQSFRRSDVLVAEEGSGSMNPKKRILSIDGGGVRGALTACFLVKLEQQVGKPCREIFDFVAGTSTGALIAAAIAAGVPATRILEIYTQRAGEIFNVSPLLTWPARFARGYAFKSANVVRVLQGEFGAAASWTLNDCPIRILLTARGVNGQTWYFVRDRSEE